MLQKASGAFTSNRDLTHVTYVEKSNRFSNRHVFLSYACVLYRHFPTDEWRYLCAKGAVNVRKLKPFHVLAQSVMVI
jgi:hypothetical protein